MKLFESLRRLLEPRAATGVDRLEQPSADRPPPTAIASAPETAEPSETTAVPASADLISAVDREAPLVDDAAEVRALLDAVAEPPVAASLSVESPATEPAPPSPPEPPPTVPPRAGDALILTLASPATTFTIAKSATLGRGQENTIRLADLSVSRRHARIVYRQGGYWLSDLGSMGGTWVDGTRLSAPQRIAAGQVIDIGLCRLTVTFAGGAVAEGRRRR